jgi:hypothetical protein
MTLSIAMVIILRIIAYSITIYIRMAFDQTTLSIMIHRKIK